MIEKARELSQAPNTYWTDQLNNHDSIAGYHALGEEIWSQTGGEIDAFVAGPHQIEGVGIGYTPPLWDPTLVDDIMAVGTEDAKDTARRLAREGALFAGTSSGANVVAAIRVGERLGPETKVVTLMADSGRKYLNADVYRSR
jgi:cysteine synthase A